MHSSSWWGATTRTRSPAPPSVMPTSAIVGQAGGSGGAGPQGRAVNVSGAGPRDRSRVVLDQQVVALHAGQEHAGRPPRRAGHAGAVREPEHRAVPRAD